MELVPRTAIQLKQILKSPEQTFTPRDFFNSENYNYINIITLIYSYTDLGGEQMQIKLGFYWHTPGHRKTISLSQTILILYLFSRLILMGEPVLIR